MNLNLKKYLRLGGILLAALVTGCGGGGGESAANIDPDDILKPVVDSVVVTPADAEVSVGFHESFKLTAVYSDSSTRDVTEQTQWQSSDAAIATIDAQGRATGVAAGKATILATYAEGGKQVSSQATITVRELGVKALQVTPQHGTLPIGLTQHFLATAIFSDDSAKDVTDDSIISWSSSNPGVATITSGQASGNGLVTGVSVGSTFITATGHIGSQSFSATVELLVTDAVVTALQVTPVTASLPIGLHQPFIATALLSDGSTLSVTDDPAISWTSSNAAVATIRSGNAIDNGLATGVSKGTTTITASGNIAGHAVSGTAELTVTDAVVTSLQVTPGTQSLPVGLHQPFTVTATLSDGTTRDLTNDSALSWISSAPAVATISSGQASDNGLATGKTVGQTTITVSGQIGDRYLSATAELTVSDAIVTSLQVEPAAVSVPLGLHQQFTATAMLSDGSTRDLTNDTAISWASSQLTVATITTGHLHGNGLATGGSLGTTTITASGNIGGQHFSDSVQLTVTDAVVTALQVTPAFDTLPVGQHQQFIATGKLSDGSTRDMTNDSALSWNSSNVALATISSSQASDNGLATAKAKGTATITASLLVGAQTLSGSAELTVSDAVLTALRVTPATATVPVGLHQQLTATGTFSDGTARNLTDDATLSWVSSAPALASVTSSQAHGNGVVSGKSLGATTITASVVVGGQTISATSAVTVNDAVITGLAVTPANVSLPDGLHQQYTATASLSDGSTRIVTNDSAISWSSSDHLVATVTSAHLAGNGLVTGVSPGTSTITATITVGGSPITGSANLTVTSAVLSSLNVTPAGLTIGRGEPQRYSAIATFTDGSTRDLTNDPTLSWTSSDSAVATISSSQGSGNGVAMGVKGGTVTITALLNDAKASASTTLTIRPLYNAVLTWGAAYTGGDSSALRSQLHDVKLVQGNSLGFAALRSDNQLLTWGTGGDGNPYSAETTNVQSVTANNAAFAALKQDGTVQTSGLAGVGGNSSGVQSQLINVRKIYAGTFTFAALKQDGSVVTWGLGWAGGDSSAVQSHLQNVVSVTPNEEAMAALLADGSVVAWGYGRGGGSISPDVQARLTQVQYIVSTDRAFSAVTGEGAVVSWGDAAFGGDNSAVASQLTGVRTIVGNDHAFAALKVDGTVVTWGNATFGGDSTAVQAQLTNVKHVVGNSTSFAALKADGTVVTWGEAARGGDSAAVQAQLTNVREIVPNGSAFAALKGDGTVVTWGLAGQGGDSSAVQALLTNVRSITGSGSQFFQLQNHGAEFRGVSFAAVKQDGTVVSWGEAANGGDSSAVQPLSGVQVVHSSMWAFIALVDSVN